MNKPKERATYGLRCRQVLTMEKDRPPISDGMLLVSGDRVKAAGPYHQLKKDFTGPVTDLGPEVLVPGPINAHTHLELSHLKGRTVLGKGFTEWVKSLIQLPMDGANEQSVLGAAEALFGYGTSCTADITGHNPETVYSALQKSRMEYVLFKELLGFEPVREIREQLPSSLKPGRDPRISLSGHALYSTHPGTLQQGKTWANKKGRPLAVHLAESPEEVELLATGRGTLAELLIPALLPADYVPPERSPIEYADMLGLLDQRTLAVHCVQAGEHDLQILKSRGASVCLCPRSNSAIGVGAAPWEIMLQAGIPVCLGTDSLCSNTDLDVWGELIHLLKGTRRSYHLQDLIRMLTVNPGLALGVHPELGTLQPGALARTSLVPSEVLCSLS